MSSRLQHILLQHEVTPPEGTWAKIASDLDDAALELKFPSQLYNHTAEPPVNAWDKIAGALDNENISSKLYDIEVAPPAAAWAGITSSLDAEKQAAVPVQRKLSPLLRYAAAAAVIALVTFGMLQLLKKKDSTADLANKENTPVIQQDTTPAAPSVSDNTPNTEATASLNISDDARNDAALEESKKTFARLDIPKHSRLKDVSNFYFAETVSTVQSRGFDINDTSPVTDPPENNNLADRYITLRTPEGNIVRMSKKLSDLACCVSGEEQDKNCKDQIKKWKDKLANACGTHSSGNFMDVLSLVNSLQDDNQ